MATADIAPQSQAIRRPRDVKKAIAIAMAKNALMSIPAVRTARAMAGRTAQARPNRADLRTYAYDLLDVLKHHLGGVEGKDVLEIGPGDNLLAGLAFLASGARSYTALDRFPGAYAGKAARAWYRLLAEDWPSYSGERWPEDLPCEGRADNRIRTIARSVETAKAIGTFDVVCSYVVGEHVAQPNAFAALTRRALRPSGCALHVIDFRGHEWNSLGDPFLFLKFPHLLWQLMGSNRGCPNRVRFDVYLQCFLDSGLKADVVQRRIANFNPADRWVVERATPGFLTEWATFKLSR